MTARPTIEEETAALRHMTIEMLLERHLMVCGIKARSKHKERLIRAIIWHLQARSEGGLSDRAVRLAADLIDPNQPFACLLGRAPKSRSKRQAVDRDRRLPKEGTILVRQYRDRLIQIRVLQQGFEYDNRIYSSLTAVALEVTGKHWNGFHFFGLSKRDDRR